MGIIARQSIKASIIGILGVCVGAISRLFIATKYLSQEEIGLLDLITKITLLIFTFFVLGTPQVIRKYYVKYKLKNKDGVFLSVYLLYLITTVSIASIIYVLSVDFIRDIYAEKSPLFLDYVYYPLYAIIVFAIFHYFNAISNVKLRIVVPALFYQFLNRILGVIFIFMYAYFHYLNLKQFTFLYTVTFFGLPAFGLLIYVLIFLKPRFSKFNLTDLRSIFKNTIRYNFFLVFSIASIYIVQAIDAQMIGAKIGLKEVGIYSIAYYIGAIIDIPQRAISNISFPILTKAFEDNRLNDIKSIYYKSSINQFLVGALMFSIIWINIDALFEIIPNGSQYKQGKFVVLFIGIGKLFNLFMGVNKQIIEASKYYAYNLINNIFLSILVVILNLIFIPLQNSLIGGINGAAFASMLALFINNIVSYLVLAYYYKFYLINKNLITILIFSAIVTLLYPILIHFYNPYIQIVSSTILLTIAYGIFVLTIKLYTLSDLRKIKEKLFNF